MLRAFGCLERDPSVRNPDFLAGRFLADSSLFRAMIRAGSLRLVHSWGRWGFERLGPGAYWMEIARVKHFDSILLDEIAAAARQVVILGAGLDSRLYRFARELQGVKAIELDHPEMAAHKRARVEDLFGALPPAVSYLSLDLSVDDLERGLEKVGFDPLAPVLVLWIGVSMYLDSAAVSSILRWLAQRPPGSSIGFDYMDRRFLDEGRRGGTRRTRKMIERSGERFGFGIDHAAVPSYVREHGLRVRSHLLPEQMERTYLTRGDGRVAGRPFGYMGFVHAAVPEPTP